MNRKNLVNKIKKMAAGEWIAVGPGVGIVRKTDGFNVQDNGWGETFSSADEAAKVAIECAKENS